MSLSEELGRAADRNSAGPPKDWRVGVEFDEEKGVGTTAPRPVTDTPVSHAEILAEFGLDPDAWQVLTLRRSKWQQSKRLENGDRDVLWLEAYRATFQALDARDPRAIEMDFEAMVQRIATWKRPTAKSAKQDGSPSTLVCALSDWQLGHGEEGGTEATTGRILASLDGAVRWLHMLRRLGYAVERVALIGLGDLIENCSGFYDMQTWAADLNMREQQALSWDLTARHIDAFVPLVDEVLVTGVAGNHGEKRNGDGKAFTSFGDNYDLGILDVMARYKERDSRWENVHIEMPTDPLAHCIRTSDVNVGFVHGHQFGKGQGAVEKARFYWQGQTLGAGPVADAQILLSGHLHHFVGHEPARGRVHFQAPAQNGGSYWFTSRTGQSAPPGMLTLLVGEHLGERGYDHNRIV